MKKLGFGSLLLLLSAASSFAGTAAQVNGTPPKGFTPSNHVTWGYQSGTSSSGTTGVNDVYSIATKHVSGDKTYGTTSASGIIYYSTTIQPGTDLTTAGIPSLPSTSSDSTMQGGAQGWTAM